MQRFLIFVGVAVVAAAMYVAASPASQQAKAPSAKQFKALKKQVAALKKDETSVKKLTVALAEIVGGCYLDTSSNLVTLPVSEVGNTSTGFYFGAAAAPRQGADDAGARSMSTRRARRKASRRSTRRASAPAD